MPQNATKHNTDLRLNVAQRRLHNRQLALRLAASGIAIFPSSGKVPLIPGWPQLDSSMGENERAGAIARYQDEHDRTPSHVGATIDADTIKRLWREFPDSVPSISCGASGLLVLDADSKRDGPAHLLQWAEHNSVDLTTAPVTETQSGGLHVFLSNDATHGCAAGGFHDMGIDVRGVGGQVIAPGAIREDGRRYVPKAGAPELDAAFVLSAIPPIPASVREMLAKRPKAPQGVSAEDERAAVDKLATQDWPTYEELTDETIGRFDLNALAEKDAELRELLVAPREDHSDNRFNFSKCLHREYGDAFDVLDFAALLEHLNDALDGAFGAFVGDDTPEQGEYSLRSIARDYLRSKACPSAANPISNGDAFGVVEDIDDYLPAHVIEDRERRKAERDSKRKRRLTFIPFADAVHSALDEVETPLIEGLLDEGAMSVMYGESNAGKSFVALDMAFHVATGRPWNGRETKKGLVVYVAAEGGNRIGKRLAALRQHFGDEADAAKFALVSSPIDLRSADGDTRALIELIREAEAHFGEKAALVVIDTASRAMAGGDENSSVDMGALVKHCDKIREAIAAHLMLIHHAGKDRAKGARGHSLLRAATDTEIEIADSKIVTRKQRDMDFAPEIPFTLRKVDLGTDRTGKPRASAVVELGAPGTAAQSSKRPRVANSLKGNQAELFAVIVAMATERGIAAGGEAHSMILPFVEVRDRVEAKRKADGAKELGDSIRSVKRCLLTKGMIVESADGMVKLPGPGDAFGAVDDDDEAD